MNVQHCGMGKHFTVRRRGVSEILKGSLCLVSILLGLVQSGSSEELSEDTLKVYYFDEIVVTATRTEAAIMDISATVSVVDRDEIEASGGNSCSDVLNTLPGLFVQKTGDFGRADVDIRGIGERGRKVTILIDGRPVKMGLYGCAITHSLPLDNVERIEVVRGPLSVLYGSDALGGVINIITKGAGKKLEGDLTVSYGSHNTQQYRLRHGGRLEKLGYHLTGDWRLSDGHLPNCAYDGKNFTAKTEYDFTEDLRVSLTGKYFDGYKEEPLRITDPDTLVSETWNDYERGALDLSLHSRWGVTKGLGKVYRNFGHHEFSDGWHSTDFTNGALVHTSANVLPNTKFATGIEFRHQGGERISEPEGEWEKKEYGVFVHGEQILLGKAILTFGARYNYDDIAGPEFCPQVGLVLHPIEGTVLRALVNKGFRSPQINELYLFPSSNDELRPERLWNYEIGLNQRLMEGVYLEAVGYTMEYENVIELGENPNPPPMFRFQNIGSFDFRGVETGARIQIGNGFLARTYYTRLDTGERTRGRPGEKIDVMLRCSRGAFTSSISVQYIADYFAADNSKDRIPDYSVVNTKLIYKLLPNLRASLAIGNLFDREYDIYVDLPSGAAGLYRMSRRTFSMGVSLEY